MNMQKTIGIVVLLIGMGYAAAILRHVWQDLRAGEKAEHPGRGTRWLLRLLEFAVYMIATLGISDYLLNTLIVKRLNLIEDRLLPGSLVLTGIVPASCIAFFMLRVEDPVALSTLLPCCGAIVLGSVLGSALVGRLQGEQIRKYMGIALIGALIMLLVRIALTGNTVGTAAGLSGWRLAAAVLLSFFAGALNMLGIPMKPTETAVFLLLGMSPLSALTLILVMACIGPMGGGIAIYKENRYSHLLAGTSVICGTVGAVCGSLITISLNAALLNVLLVIATALAIVTMLRRPGKQSAG